MMVKTTSLFLATCAVFAQYLKGMFAEAQDRVFFDPEYYTVMENVGTFSLTVTRDGGDVTRTLCVDFKSTDGTAIAGSDYEYTEGTLVFYAGDIHRQFSLTVIDDDFFEEDKHFYVALSNIREGQGNNCDGNSISGATLDSPYLATIKILDDDHSGKFGFEESQMKVSDTIGVVSIKVVRSLGAHGRVNVAYHSVDGTARSEVDFTPVDSFLTFENDENEQYINVGIVDADNAQTRKFKVMLGEPRLIEGGSWTGIQPKLGDISKIKIQLI